MSDAAVLHLVTGLITITTMVVGFLTLWVKLKYGVEKANEAATNAARVEVKLDANTAVTNAVEKKIDANTLTTNSVDQKADTIVHQTDGALSDALRVLVAALTSRVDKLEVDNRERGHRVLDALNAVHLKVAELVALQPRPILPVLRPATEVWAKEENPQ